MPTPPPQTLAEALHQATAKRHRLRSRRPPRPRAKARQPYDIDSLTDIAVRVFNEHGYDGTSMEQIAHAAGITKSSLYHHVTSKEEFLARALDRAFSALFAVLDEPGATEGRAADRLRYILRRAVETEIQFLPEVSLLLRVRGNTQTERGALERRREFDAFITTLVRQAVKAGEVRADIDPALLSRLLFGMAHWLTDWYRPEGPLGAAEIVDAILKLAFEGIRRPPDQPPG